MDVVGKVEDGGALWQAEQVALGREDEHLVVIQVGVHVAHQAHLALLAAGLKHLAHLVHPLVGVAIALDALVAPVGCHTALGGLVHALGAYLHLDPLVARAIHGDVQRLIAVALGDGDPVLEAGRVGLVDVGDDGVGEPAGALLVLGRGVQDDAYGKQVIDAVQVHILFLHLLPDAVDGLGASLEFEFEPLLAEPPLDGLDELVDVEVAFLLGLVQAVGDQRENLAVQVLEREVLEFGLDGIQSQLVGQRGIQVARLAGNLVDKFLVGVVVDGAHEGQAVDGHDEDDAHVLGKGEQQLVEVLVLDSGLFLVERGHVEQAVDDAGDVVAQQRPDALHVQVVAAAQVVDHRGQRHGAVGGDAVTQGERRAQVPHDGVQPVLVPLEDARLADALLESGCTVLMSWQVSWSPSLSFRSLTRLQHLLLLLCSEIPSVS